MRRQLATGFSMIVVLTVLTGLLYPLAVLAVSQAAFKDKADGSLVTAKGVPVGSSLLGQGFTDPKHFHPRPSAAGKTGYDALASSPSNLGPTNDKLIADCSPVPATTADGRAVVDATGNPVNATNPDGSPVCDPNTVPQRAAAYRSENNLTPETPVPVDAVTASGSGLDPAISVANARLQAQRVADARGRTPTDVLTLVDAHTTPAPLGVLGEPTVNVLELNLALDGEAP